MPLYAACTKAPQLDGLKRVSHFAFWRLLCALAAVVRAQNLCFFKDILDLLDLLDLLDHGWVLSGLC